MEFKESYLPRIFSDLEGLDFKLNEIKKWHQSKVSYQDFYKYYADLTGYLKKINFPGEDMNQMIQSYPVLNKPNVFLYNNCHIWMFFIPGVLNYYIFFIIVMMFLPFALPLIGIRIWNVLKVRKEFNKIQEINNILNFRLKELSYQY